MLLMMLVMLSGVAADDDDAEADADADADSDADDALGLTNLLHVALFVVTSLGRIYAPDGQRFNSTAQTVECICDEIC